MSGRQHDNRAVRLGLIGQLGLARQASGLLHQKEEALRRERDRLEGHAKRTERRWQRTCQDARAWLLRARALGASTELAAVEHRPIGQASITVRWRNSMGVAYPDEVITAPCPRPTVSSTAALVPTTDAYRTALDAAIAHGAASSALEKIDTELVATRRRRRAIEHRLVPTLELRLRRLELRLDEQDREEALRSRLAIQQRTDLA